MDDFKILTNILYTDIFQLADKIIQIAYTLLQTLCSILLPFLFSYYKYYFWYLFLKIKPINTTNIFTPESLM